MLEMIELSHKVEKKTPERLALARQLRAIRSLERADGYVKNRGLKDYLSVFQGLYYFFDYVHKLGTSPIVLDVGAGISQGVWELSQAQLGRDLTFIATGLIRNRKVVKDKIGLENYRVTSGERLRGIPDNSVAAILALNSVAYSVAPDLVVSRFDQVLIPGGVIKSTFRSYDLSIAADFYNRYQFQTPQPFEEELKKLGYDIAVLDNGVGSTMLAIKPGGIPDITAQQLLDTDGEAYKKLQPQDKSIYLQPFYLKIFLRENQLSGKLLSSFKSYSYELNSDHNLFIKSGVFENDPEELFLINKNLSLQIKRPLRESLDLKEVA